MLMMQILATLFIIVLSRVLFQAVKDCCARYDMTVYDGLVVACKKLVWCAAWLIGVAIFTGFCIWAFNHADAKMAIDAVLLGVCLLIYIAAHIYQRLLG